MGLFFCLFWSGLKTKNFFPRNLGLVAGFYIWGFFLVGLEL